MVDALAVLLRRKAHQIAAGAIEYSAFDRVAGQGCQGTSDRVENVSAILGVAIVRRELAPGTLVGGIIDPIEISVVQTKSQSAGNSVQNVKARRVTLLLAASENQLAAQRNGSGNLVHVHRVCDSAMAIEKS